MTATCTVPKCRPPLRLPDGTTEDQPPRDVPDGAYACRGCTERLRDHLGDLARLDTRIGGRS